SDLLNRCYLDEGSLHLEQLGRGYAWLDTGTHRSLLEASTFIETIEARQGLRVCCPEEIAWSNGWINDDQLQALAAPLAKNGYGQYLQSLVARDRALKLFPTALPGGAVIETRGSGDERGDTYETWRAARVAAAAARRRGRAPRLGPSGAGASMCWRGARGIVR